MPKFDQTGPLGQGPMTGRGLGCCGTPAGRQGFGFGWRRFGGGRGLGRYFNWGWPETKEDQTKALVEYKKALIEELEDVKKEEEELNA